MFVCMLCYEFLVCRNAGMRVSSAQAHQGQEWGPSFHENCDVVLIMSGDFFHRYTF